MWEFFIRRKYVWQITHPTDASQFGMENTYKILTSKAHWDLIDAFLPKGSQENEKVPCIDHAVLIDI
tara:strand:+ start:1592 stop:1792 length:201 start_codon:yes stop_codon:yes gene_type:complete